MAVEKKDVRWFYAGVIASSILVTGSVVSIYPSIVAGNSGWFLRFCVRSFGFIAALFSATWFVFSLVIYILFAY